MSLQCCNWDLLLNSNGFTKRLNRKKLIDSCHSLRIHVIAAQIKLGLGSHNQFKFTKHKPVGNTVFGDVNNK